MPAPVPRLLKPEDAAAFRAIRLEALWREPAAFAADHAEEAAQPLPWFAERLACSAVFGAGAPVLDAMAGLMPAQPARERHKGWVWGVYVRPTARGQGLGRVVVEAVVAHARGRLEELRLGVAVANAGARALYRSAGFREYAVEPRALKLGDAYVDEALMLLRL